MPSIRKGLKIAALLLACFVMVVGVVGIVSPGSLTTVRRLYFATPGKLYAAGAVRLAMGLVLILAASGSRWPKILRALGAAVCLQGLSVMVFGMDRAREILDWEAAHPALLRIGAAAALIASGFVAFAVAKPQSDQPNLSS